MATIPAEAQDVLAYWFDGDAQEIYRTKWFPASGGEIQAATDAEITSKFKNLLGMAEKRELHQSWISHPHSFVALIVLIDQFSRHIYRHDADKRKENDILALELATMFVDLGYHLQVIVPHFVFAMMPFRHSPTPERLENVLDQIDRREATMTEHTDLLSKFRRTTVQRQSHMRVSEHDPEADEFDILERAAFLHPNEALLLPKHSLVPVMHHFLTSMRAGSSECPAIGISLSGGVDSMVIAYLLVKLAPRFNNYKVVAVHIDYLNRIESSAEAAYVRQWATANNMECFVREVNECQRATTKREDYEKLSRDIRYTTYQDIMAQFSIPGMCVGHHRGDVQENVISNMMKGQSLLGLNGMTPSSIVNGVRIWRPLLSVDKTDIFDFAHMFGIPYFKDTTPQWSTRGKLRRRLMPLLQEIYGEGYLNNLSNLGQEATECAEVLESALLGPVLDTVKSSGLAVWIDLSLLCSQPMFLWKEILRRVCHERMGERMIRDKPMLELRLKVLKSNFKASWITLKKQTKSYVTNSKCLVLFREPVFQQIFPLGIEFALNQTTMLGPWSIHLRLAAADDEQVCQLQDKRWDMWNVIQTSGVSYILPHAPQYIIDTEDRPGTLRGIDKCLTDAMPLVMNRGILQESENVVVVTLTYITSMTASRRVRGSPTLLGMELHVEKVLDSVRQLKQREPQLNSLALSKWKCDAALNGLGRSSSSEPSVDGECAVKPVNAEEMRYHSKFIEKDHESQVDRQHMESYMHHFNGLEGYGKSGLSKLQQLIDTALTVRTRCKSANEYGVSIGVAVLSSTGRMYTSSTADLCLGTCPEQLAFMKLASDEEDFFVEGCAISSTDELFSPYPCGSCREFLCQFGDFPIYLIRESMEYEQTTAFALFPRSQQSIPSSNHAKKCTYEAKKKENLKPRHLLHPKDWLVAHAVDWLVEDVGLPEYSNVFEAHDVNGSTLMYLEESDLQYLLRIEHPLHRKRIALCLHRLRDQDALQSSIEYGQLRDYLAVLDKDRIEVVVKLKEAFDTVDTNGDGVLGFSEIKKVLSMLKYDASASSVEAWIQTRSNASSVSFSEFVLAFCHTWTSNVQDLPVPKIDLANVRAAFDRIDSNGNGSLEKHEVVQALAALGHGEAEKQTNEWFEQVDADHSNSLSFPEFLLRFAMLKHNLSPLRSAFESFGSSTISMELLPQVFRSLQVLYDRSKLDKWTQARTIDSISFADFVLAYFLFVEAPAPISSEEERHRYRIVQLQQSGHVRLCTRNLDENGRAKSLSPKRAPKQYKQRHEESKSDDDDEEEESKEKEESEEDEFAAVRKMFRRFHEKQLTTLEAMQAITELGVVVPRTQMLDYFTREGFGTKRNIEYDDLVRAYRKMKVFKPCPSRRLKRDNKTRMETIKDLLDGKYGVPFTRKDFGNDYSNEEKENDCPSVMSQREWAEEMKSWVSKRKHRPKEDENDDRSSQSSASPIKPKPTLGRFQIGDRVVDKTRSMGPGTVIRLNGRYQVCSIHFDSGIKRHNVAFASLRKYKDAPLTAFRAIEPFEKGCDVQVLYKGTKAIRHGIVKKVRSDTDYDVEYSDGEVEKHVAYKHMTLSKRKQPKVEKWEEGMSVEARGKDSPTYYKGKISKCRANGTYDIKFKNGAEEDKLPPKWVRKVSSNDEEETKDNDYEAEFDEDDVAFEQFDVVEARFGGDKKYFQGQIKKCRSNGTFDIMYEDGDEEKEVSKEMIRFLNIELEKGDKVEARFGGKEAFYSGCIIKVHSDGTHDIEYSDGDSEKRVHIRFIRPSKEKKTKFQVGQSIEAKFGGQGKFYAGEITRIHSDDTLDIEYSDGDRESRVNPTFVRPVATKPNDYEDDFE